MNQDTRYEPYHIIQRKTRKGKKVFYVRFLSSTSTRSFATWSYWGTPPLQPRSDSISSSIVKPS